MSFLSEVDLPQLATIVNSKDWSQKPLYFVGDVGGTYARLGFGMASSDAQSLKGLKVTYVRFHMRKKEINQVKDFFDEIINALLSHEADSVDPPQRPAAATYLVNQVNDRKGLSVQRTLAALQGNPVLRRVVCGVLAVPGPVHHNGTMGGPFNQLKGTARVDEFPTFLFPVGRGILLNDIESAAYGLTTISRANLFSEYMEVLWEGRQWQEIMGDKSTLGTTIGKGNCLVMCPGSGLGSAYICYKASTDSYDILSTEVGSMTVPDGIQDRDYLDGLALYLGLTAHSDTNDDKNAVDKTTRTVRLNCEQLTTGSALEYNYYRILMRKSSTLQRKKIRHSPLKAAEIAALAEKGDEDALQAMTQLFDNLMKVCAECNLFLQPFSVALIGNNIIKNRFFFQLPAVRANLYNALLQHPMEQRHPGWMQQSTFIRQVKDINMNLVGCVGVALREQKLASKAKL
ncbi:glucokinase [Angomonas deanei]|nr:glucokinase [Angomonas deanei]EPY42788.1 glucokinase [Angomonas deanei]EPY42824.1 glucokinase [Angomonas deanei]|eukprot:EPY37427.1 glucokinase [Angomonas deanei]